MDLFLTIHFISFPFSLQFHHLPQHLCQFLSHRHPLTLRLGVKLKVQEAQAITHREIETMTEVKLRYVANILSKISLV